MKGQLKILIIDDDELGNETLKLLLKDILTQKVDVDSIYSGKNAVSLIEQNKYDLVFLDNKLPDITGLEVLKQIKEKNIKTSVIFITGFSDEQLAVKAMKLGAIDYISKGNMDVSRLLEAVNELVVDSCNVLEIDPETLSKIQDMFLVSEEIKPRNSFELKYENDQKYEEEITKALDIMQKNYYVEKTKTFSTVACPHCGSNPEEMYIACPICDSLDLTKGEVIEHNKCHHIDFKINFVDEDGNFVCPKCGEKLKQIGVDYIKIGNNYKCNNSHIFPYPEHKYKCKECGIEYKEDDANIKGIYKYKILEDGKTSLNICNSILDPDRLNAINEKQIEMYK